jgi:WD40 repeat protein
MAQRDESRIGLQFGDYRLIRFLGRGNFGDVYLGEHVGDVSENKLAAIKLLKEKLTDPDDLKGFINEARIFRLIHPNIVRLLDFGIGEDDIPYLVMVYAPNGTLRSLHPRKSRLSLEIIVVYVKQIAAALQHAHDRKVIHRDVKPENILLGLDNEILLSDFGIAAVAHSTRSLSTQDASGTIHYMAPEHIQGKARPASDQYSLGIVVYEWICGELPFYGTLQEIAIMHTIATPASLLEKVAELSPEVEKVVMKALAKDPKERFPGVLAFASALEEAAQMNPPIGSTLYTYNGHSDEVRTVIWSPDGIHVVSGSTDKTAQVWTTTWQDGLINGGAARVTYHGHARSVNSACWSPDGLRIATASLDGTVQVWDAATGNFIFTYSGHTNWVRAVAWSPDGKYIASGSWDETVHIWHADTGENIFTYPGHSDEVRTVAWSPDGTRIASGAADKTARVWNVGTGQTIITYKGHRKSVNTLAWSPDGQSVVSGSLDGATQVWDASTGETKLTYLTHSDGVNTVAWSPNGRRIASGGKDNSVHIWDAVTGNTIYIYSGHINWLMAISWSPDSKYIASGSVDKLVQVWRAV